MSEETKEPRKKAPELKKPPLGLRPRWIVDLDRLEEIAEAMIRYEEGGQKIPVEWRKEFQEVVDRLTAHFKTYGTETEVH